MVFWRILVDRPGRFITIAILSATLMAFYVFQPPRMTQKRSKALLDEAYSAYEIGRYDAAIEAIQEVRRFFPRDARACLLAALVKLRSARLAEAQEILLQVSDADCRELGPLLHECGRSFGTQKSYKDAERWFLKALDSSNPVNGTIQELVSLYRMSGRNNKAATLIQRLISANEANLRDILMLSLPSKFWGSEQDLSTLESTKFLDDQNPIANLGLARKALDKDEPKMAVDLLRNAVKADPELGDAHAWLGVALARSEDFASLALWELDLPEEATDHPMAWFARGELASHHNDRDAVGFYWETINRCPTDVTSYLRLSQQLKKQGFDGDAELISGTVISLARLSPLSHDLLVTRDFAVAKDFVNELESLKLYNEAAAFCEHAGTWKPRNEWYSTKAKELRSRSKGPRLPLARRLGLKVDIPKAFPIEDDIRTARQELSKSDDSIAKLQPPGEFRFEEVAMAAGVEHTFFNGADAATGGAYIFEFSGAGVGMLDYDENGWPDIYLTQGTTWPVSASTGKYFNRLFRNRGNDTFQEVAHLAGVADQGFGQGATVADFNNDGFDDFYVCNIGANRMYENNGDGTFSDITMATGTGGNSWSISSAAADFDGDSRPDLYVVNYLEGDDLFTRQCTSNGVPTQCLPQMFPAAMDRLYRNLNEGLFEDITDSSGITVPNGKGMGVIVSDINRDHQLDIVVANDTEPNFLFVNSSAGPDIQFKESAITNGIALGKDGKPQSSMGLAMADINRDRLNDIFVTNFFQEHNNLFLGLGDAFFRDVMADSGLEPGLAVEGWGAQFLDADLDGFPDLFVANGHLQDFSPRDSGRMKAHFFQNVGGRFNLTNAVETSSYLTENHFGRSVAVSDWNRDGRPDLCVTHVDSPTALLLNKTDCSRSHYLVVRLIGTSVSRDAIGAEVAVKLGTNELREDLKAGNGYASANERVLFFGLGFQSEIKSISITWPSGETEVIEKVQSDTEIIVVEKKGYFVAPDHRSPKADP
jgi:tetratricopeptide (TPR) repeat protein